jgi:hypothetical protein
VVSASGEGPDGAFDVSVQGSGEYRQVNFDTTTRQGQQYAITVRYTVDRSVFDATTINGQSYVTIGWAPFAWGLAITTEEIEYILPIEISSDITQPEQVTDAVVNATGLVTPDLSNFDRWVYFPTPDEPSGKVYLSIFVAKNNLAAQAEMVPTFYLPAGDITTTSKTPIPLNPTASGATSGTTSGGDTTSSGGTTSTSLHFGTEALAGMFCLGVPITLGVLALLINALRRRKPKMNYEPPEIEIETFQTPGVVPDLNAIETAFYMGNSTKTIALIVLALEQRGIVNIVNHSPLQLEILKPDEKVATYERALLDAIMEDGTIDKEKVPAILAAVAAVVQPKMWNADPEATRRTYQKRIDTAWEDYEREWRRAPQSHPCPTIFPGSS